MANLRGYIFSRAFAGQRIPQHMQNLVIRDYCQRNGHTYLLSAAEYAMHTVLSYENQPFVTANYTIFVAEVASTFNEQLLSKHLMENARSDEERAFLINREIDGIRGTIIRQTMFAEFELATHDAMERGEALSGKKMTQMYCGLLRKYHGADSGVMQIDPLYCQEWSFIPHFYRTYYVFQYATSFTASAALSEKVMAGDPAATKRFLSFLSAGGSKYPIDLLKDAGVDMTTDEPLELTMKKMNRVMDEMEKLLAAKK